MNKLQAATLRMTLSPILILLVLVADGQGALPDDRTVFFALLAGAVVIWIFQVLHYRRAVAEHAAALQARADAAGTGGKRRRR